MARKTRYAAVLDGLCMRLSSYRTARNALAGLAPAAPDAQGRTWFRIENKAESDGPVTVHIYDEIGMWGVSADLFMDALREVGGRDLTLRINSPGGEVFDGVAIYNALQRHPGRITGHVDGLAASAASFIAMAADELVMEPGTQMMIHDAQGMCWGDAKAARELADMLDRTSDTIAMIYAERAGGDAATWRETMRATTWYDGPAAVEAKLADRVGETRAREGGREESAPEAVADVKPDKGDDAIEDSATPRKGPARRPANYLQRLRPRAEHRAPAWAYDPGQARGDDGKWIKGAGGYMSLDEYGEQYDVHDERTMDNGITAVVMSNGDYQLAMDDEERPGERAVLADLGEIQIRELRLALGMASNGDEDEEIVVGDVDDPICVLTSYGNGDVNFRAWSTGGDGVETEHEFDLGPDEVDAFEEILTDILAVEVSARLDPWTPPVWAGSDSTSEPVSSSLDDHHSAPMVGAGAFWEAWA